MKTQLLTVLIRWCFAVERPMPAWLARAAAQNPELARVVAAEQGLSTGLKIPTGMESVKASPYLKAKTLRAIEASPASTDSRVRWLSPAFSLVTLAICLGVVVTTSTGRKKASGPAVAVTSTQPSQLVVPPGTSVEAKTLVQTSGGEWVNPLDSEVDRVLADTKTAVRFLSMSFLPSSSLNAAPGSAAKLPRRS